VDVRVKQVFTHWKNLDIVVSRAFAELSILQKMLQ
jgi:16S rRNA G527 N7-methylase RsmG